MAKRTKTKRSNKRTVARRPKCPLCKHALSAATAKKVRATEKSSVPAGTDKRRGRVFKCPVEGCTGKSRGPRFNLYCLEHAHLSTSAKANGLITPPAAANGHDKTEAPVTAPPSPAPATGPAQASPAVVPPPAGEEGRPAILPAAPAVAEPEPTLATDPLADLNSGAAPEPAGLDSI